MCDLMATGMYCTCVLSKNLKTTCALKMLDLVFFVHFF